MTDRRHRALGLLPILAACGGEPPGAVAVRDLYFVAWPGRPVSDAMERLVLADPRVQAALAGFRFERVTVEGAPPPVRAALGGTGFVVLDGAQVVGVARGAVPVRRLLRFLALARRPREGVEPATRLRELLELGLPARALDELDRAAGRGLEPRDALALEVDARLAGEVAGARAAFDRAPPAARTAACEAIVLVAERRARDAIEVLESAGTQPVEPAAALALGRALLDLDLRERAYAVLEPLARGGGREADAATDLLDAALFGGHGHVHR